MKTLFASPVLRQRRGQPSRSAGFSLLEVMISSGVLVIGLLALTSTSMVAHSLDRSDEARQTASQALRAATERVQALSIRAATDELGWATTLSDSLLPGGTPGAVFDVPRLEAWAGEASVGSLTLITDETLTDASLGVNLGMPRDLNGDGDASDTDVADNATVLPVIVRVRWDMGEGEREMSQGLFVVGI